MPFPSNSLLDNFNRANADPLSGNWLTPILIAALLGENTLTSNAIGNRAGNSFWNNPIIGPDCESYITMVGLPTAGAGPVYCYVRMTTTDASSDGYSVDFRITGGSVHTFRLMRFTDGDGTELASRTDITFSAGDSIGIEIIGNAIKGYRKNSGVWTELLSTTDSVYTSRGYIGFGKADEFIVLDDFGGGTINNFPNVLTSHSISRIRGG